MSQAATWGVPQGSPASPATYATRDQASLDALMTLHSGASRPAYLTEGLWINTAASPTLVLYYFDGTNDITLGTIDITGNTFTPVGGTLNNYAATTAPTINDDSADGYTVGSVWINTSTSIKYTCTSNSIGAAVWKQTVDTNTAQTITNKSIDAANNTITNIPLTALAAQAANTFVANASASSAVPTASVALSASQLAGRGSTGNLAAITLGTGLSMSGTTLNSTGGISQVVTQVFTSSGTYTPTSGMKYCVVEVVGGGGGGGGTQSASGGGGGGGGSGGYSRETIDAATIGASQSVTIGAAGSAGTSGGGSAGTGGTTSLGSLLQATGGTGGAGWVSGSAPTFRLGGNAGVGSGGSVNLAGEEGGTSLITGTAGTGVAGRGASSHLGGGKREIIGTASAGQAGGANTGAGGSGANCGAGTASAGGAGAAGIVIITEYI